MRFTIIDHYADFAALWDLVIEWEDGIQQTVAMYKLGFITIDRVAGFSKWIDSQPDSFFDGFFPYIFDGITMNRLANEYAKHLAAKGGV